MHRETFEIICNCVKLSVLVDDKHSSRVINYIHRTKTVSEEARLTIIRIVEIIRVLTFGVLCCSTSTLSLKA